MAKCTTEHEPGSKAQQRCPDHRNQHLQAPRAGSADSNARPPTLAAQPGQHEIAPRKPFDYMDAATVERLVAERSGRKSDRWGGRKRRDEARQALEEVINAHGRPEGPTLADKGFLVGGRYRLHLIHSMMDSCVERARAQTRLDQLSGARERLAESD